jgi:hypothetical protein
MKPNACLNLLKFPPLIVALLLQIAPFCRTVFVNPGMFQSGFAIVFKWIAGAGLTVGAIDAVSGASATITGLRPYVGTTQIGPTSLSPSIPAGAGNITLRIIVANPGVNPEQAYWDCTPLPTSLSINTAVGSSGYITNLPGQLTVAGVYNVTLKAGNTLFGFITTNATITVTNTSSGSPPTITSPPVNQTGYLGGSASFSVTATSSQPMTYQWRHGGANVGANSPTLVIDPVNAGDAGSYDVVVGNPSGSVTSTPAAVLTVASPPALQLQFSQPASGPPLINWQALAGKTYTLQRRDNFTPDTWHDLGQTTVTADGPVQQTDDTASGVPVRFYRIQTE